MAIIIYDAGAKFLADEGITNSNSWKVDLYQNNHAAVRTDTIANYTLCTYPGYAQQTSGAWTDAAGSGGAQTGTGTLMTFLASAADVQSIYGFIIRNAANVLLMGGLFPAGPYAIGGAGAGVAFTPAIATTY